MMVNIFSTQLHSVQATEHYITKGAGNETIQKHIIILTYFKFVNQYVYLCSENEY